MSNTVLTLVGSLRDGSLNRQLADAAVAAAPEGTEVLIFEGLGEIPFYNQDLDTADAPAQVQALRAAVAAADALLLVSPEFNGALPSVLSNAIDWASRPYGAGSISGKPAAVIGTSPSGFGAKWAHEGGRRSLGVAGAAVVENAELSVGGAFDRWADTHPAEDAELLVELRGILGALTTVPATA